VGVSIGTLHNWRKSGRIEAVKTPGGQWEFNVRPFVGAKAGTGRKGA
jgi:predicted site-specific integrase-resolvase